MAHDKDLGDRLDHHHVSVDFNLQTQIGSVLNLKMAQEIPDSTGKNFIEFNLCQLDSHHMGLKLRGKTL